MPYKKCKKCSRVLSVDDFSNKSKKCRSCENKRKSEYYKKLKTDVIGHYSNGSFSCACCGESSIEFLTIDHISNDGANKRKQDKSHRKIYSWIKRNNYPESMFRVLCFNCNCSHGIFGYCPHKIKK